MTRTYKVINNDQFNFPSNKLERETTFLYERKLLIGPNFSSATLTYLRQLTSEVLKAGCEALLLRTLCLLGFGALIRGGSIF